jgi:ABC-type polysaccharide/polyol phosphate export permease
MVIWQLISGTLNEAPTTFSRQAMIIRNVVMPVSFFVIRAFSRQIINLCHNLLIVIGVIIYFNLPLTTTTLFVVPGLILVIGNLFWITFVLGFLGARFRDIEYTIQAVLPLLFFISPVIFRADKLPLTMNIVRYNPFAYFIEIIRQPLLGTATDLLTYQLMLGLMLIGTTITIGLSKKYTQRLAFWV